MPKLHGNPRRTAPLSNLQRLQNKFLRTTGNFPRRTLTRDLHVVLKIPYLQDFVTKLFREQARVLLKHDNVNVGNTGQGGGSTKKV
jgi:hypothetical protein